ncbi:MAG TPA: metal-dependent hydrolase [Sandaracinaceae bacterium LLY-WYZ-13_1]|nr:metal-dependent hydrolase [Sandaracinaceae bacterium LLY-WYZ-13_1]
MASLGHVAVGLAAGRFHGDRGGSPVRAMVGFSALSLAADLDVVAFALGIPYEAPFGHRGASHSLFVALGVGCLCALLARDPEHRWRLARLGVIVAASHGLLDTLTDGGLGIALLWPLSDARFFAPWRPIPVAPIGAGMLSARGLWVVAAEAALFAPLLLYALGPRRARG